ncbi:Stage II sporulation protein E (SpoIIE) [compost metagenome]
MNHELPAGSARLYLPTDGFFDQNGGERDHSFGKTRFEKLLEKYRDFSAAQQKDALVQELEAYMAGERQRDDIAVLSFRTGTRNDVKPTGRGDLA